MKNEQGTQTEHHLSHIPGSILWSHYFLLFHVLSENTFCFYAHEVNVYAHEVNVSTSWKLWKA